MKSSYVGLLFTYIILSNSCISYNDILPKPHISVTNESISDWAGSLEGYAHGIKPEFFQISIYIRKRGFWHHFPDASSGRVKIYENNAWECQNLDFDIDNVTEISIFLLPDHFTAPLLTGEGSLPVKLYLVSVATFRCRVDDIK